MPEEIFESSGPNHSIKVEKNSRGYNWEVKVSHPDAEYIKTKIAEFTAWCEAHYGASS